MKSRHKRRKMIKNPGTLGETEEKGKEHKHAPKKGKKRPKKIAALSIMPWWCLGGVSKTSWGCLGGVSVAFGSVCLRGVSVVPWRWRLGAELSTTGNNRHSAIQPQDGRTTALFFHPRDKIDGL